MQMQHKGFPMKSKLIDLEKYHIVPDTRIYVFASVSKETGRERMKELETRGDIEVLRTPTGRRWLRVIDAQCLVNYILNYGYHNAK